MQSILHSVCEGEGAGASSFFFHHQKQVFELSAHCSAQGRAWLCAWQSFRLVFWKPRARLWHADGGLWQSAFAAVHHRRPVVFRELLGCRDPGIQVA